MYGFGCQCCGRGFDNGNSWWIWIIVIIFIIFFLCDDRDRKDCR